MTSAKIVTEEGVTVHTVGRAGVIVASKAKRHLQLDPSATTNVSGRVAKEISDESGQREVDCARDIKPLVERPRIARLDE